MDPFFPFVPLGWGKLRRKVCVVAVVLLLCCCVAVLLCCCDVVLLWCCVAVMLCCVAVMLCCCAVVLLMCCVVAVVWIGKEGAGSFEKYTYDTVRRPFLCPKVNIDVDVDVVKKMTNTNTGSSSSSGSLSNLTLMAHKVDRFNIKCNSRCCPNLKSNRHTWRAGALVYFLSWEETYYRKVMRSNPSTRYNEYFSHSDWRKCALL